MLCFRPIPPLGDAARKDKCDAAMFESGLKRNLLLVNRNLEYRKRNGIFVLKFRENERI